MGKPRERLVKHRGGGLLPMMHEARDFVREDRRLVTFSPRNAIQAEYADAMDTQRLVFGIGPAGTGKAQPLDAMIKIPGGWARMGDITPGMTITAADGSNTIVEAVYPQGEKDIYRVVFEDGRVAECCDDHLWRVYRFDWEPAETRWRVIPLSEVRRLLALSSAADRLYVSLPTPELANDIELPLDPYAMGLLIGDGHFGRDSVRISTSDREIVSAITSALPSGMVVRHRKGFDYELVRDAPRGWQEKNPVLETVRDLGLAQTRSSTKFIPDIFLNGSPAQRLALLQGLLDSDGTITATCGVSFATVSKTLSQQVQTLVRSLGGIASISTKQPSYSYKGEKRQGQLAYNVKIRIAEPATLFRLTRKKVKVPTDYQYSDCLRLRICSVELIGRKQAQCIAISHSERLYVTDDYVVTHNTWVCGAKAAEGIQSKSYERIIITRPAMEAGESLGFLPGELAEKFDPYFRPFRHVLERHLGKGVVEAMMKAGRIEAMPLALMRGHTFDDSFVVLDEAQNTTPVQMKLFLTRIGERSTVVVNGDPTQVDLPVGQPSGLPDALYKLRGLPLTKVIRFTEGDIVRSGLVQDIVRRYETKPAAVDPMNILLEQAALPL